MPMQRYVIFLETANLPVTFDTNHRLNVRPLENI